MTQREAAKIELQGYTARQSGRKPEQGPYFGKPTLRDQHGVWLRGWQKADADNRGSR